MNKNCLAREVFKNSYHPLNLLHLNDYILEKAFVYGIVALSKWMGEDCVEVGVYGDWSPPFPAGLAPMREGAPPVDLEASIGDDHIPPHLRVGMPSSSSSSRPA